MANTVVKPKTRKAKEPKPVANNHKAILAPKIPEPDVGEIPSTDALSATTEAVAAEPTFSPIQESPSQTEDTPLPNPPDTITFIPHSELHPFKGHPFQIRNDTDMQALIASVKERGISQPALVRPRDDGGYEIIAGHRRQFASKEAGYAGVPCVIRNMSDEEAVLAMTESNFNQRTSILASERAKALRMQLEAIKRQGTRNGVSSTDLGRRSNEIIAERNGMSVKNVQRYIALNNLIPELIQYVDDKKMKFTAAVDLSYVRPRNQRYIALAIEAQQESPSVSQAQKLRELDQQNVLNADTIDGIMTQDKREEIKVILNAAELSKYFSPDKTPREMKEQILKLLDEWKEKEPVLAKPGKETEKDK